MRSDIQDCRDLCTLKSRPNMAAGMTVWKYSEKGRADRQTFSVNLELLEPSWDGWLRPNVPLGGQSGFGLCGGLKLELPPFRLEPH